MKNNAAAKKIFSIISVFFLGIGSIGCNGKIFGSMLAKDNTELIALASRDPNSFVGFGGNIPPALIKNLSVTNNTIARDLTAVRQVYGSVGLSARNFDLMIAARTVDEYAARNLGNTVEALKQFGAIFINRLPAAKGALAKSALGNLKVTNQGNELQIRTVVDQADIAPLVGRN